MSGNPLLSVYILNWETEKLIETSVHVHLTDQLQTREIGLVHFVGDYPLDTSLGHFSCTNHLFRVSYNLTHEGFKPGYQSSGNQIRREL